LLRVGQTTPTGSGYYVNLGGEVVHIVSKPGIDALLVLLSNPPYAFTDLLTPSPESPTPDTPTETATPDPEDSNETATPTATP
jgi:hypothetical protein